MHIAHYIALVHRSGLELAKACLEVATQHAEEPDVDEICLLFAEWSRRQSDSLKPFIARYEEAREREPERLHSDLFRGARQGGLGLLRDLHDLWLMATEAQISWMVLSQAALALRDRELEQVCQANLRQTKRQIAWFETRAKQAAPQALIAA